MSHNNSQLRIALHTCQMLGVPAALDKIHEPSNILTFLCDRLYVSPTSSSRTQVDRAAPNAGAMTHNRFMHQVGTPLSGWTAPHASAVVKPGRTFLRHLIDLSTTVTKLHHHIRLTNSAHSDIQWWHSFLAIWNGISYLPLTVPTIFIESNASGLWGGAEIWGCQWFHFRWPDSWQNINIAVKELLPIVMATAIWGKEWSGQSVRCWCDNEAVVAVVNTGWCRDRHLMHQMRSLFFYAAHFRCCVSAHHIAGAVNSKADTLSRSKLFFLYLPAGQPHPFSNPTTPAGTGVGHQPVM